MVPPIPFHPYLLSPSTRRLAFRKPQPDSGARHESWRLRISDEGVSGCLLGEPEEPAGPPQPRFPAPPFCRSRIPGRKVLGSSAGIEFLQLKSFLNLGRFGTSGNLRCLFLPSIYHCTFPRIVISEDNEWHLTSVQLPFSPPNLSFCVCLSLSPEPVLFYFLLPTKRLLVTNNFPESFVAQGSGLHNPGVTDLFFFNHWIIFIYFRRK